MPTYANQILLGEGKFRAMVLIEGWPEIFVSDAGMVGNSNETPVRSQILGLDPQTIRISASVDMMRAELTEQEQTFEIIDDSEVVRGYVLSSGSVTASLSKAPTLTTYLTADLTTVGTTISVSSTNGFAATGVVHIGTEAIYYGGLTGTSFTTLTRSIWGTTLQKHFVGDGDRLGYPRITNRPRTLRGRRVKVYLFGKADTAVISPTFLRWRGVTSSDVAYREGRYSFSVEPVSKIFDQMVGGDVEEPIPIRGIYLPNPGSLDFFVGTSVTGVRGPVGVLDAAVRVATSGFFADNEALCTSINTAIATATAGFSWDASTLLVAQSDGLDGWRLVYRVGSATARYAEVRFWSTPDRTHGASPVDRLASESEDSEGVGQWSDPLTGLVVTTLIANQQYHMRFDAPVPRAVLGSGFSTQNYSHPASTASPDVLYLGGSYIPTLTGTVVGISADGEGESDMLPSITGDSATRSLTLYPGEVRLLGAQTTIRIARILKVHGTLSDLLVALVLNSPALVNSGAMPMLTYGDLLSTFGDLVEAERDGRAVIRTWVCAEGVTLKEIITHEARLLGVYPAPDATGLITWKRLRPPLKTDVAAFTLAASTLGPSLPSVSRASSGHLREVVIRQGWDPIEAEHSGLTIRVRDVQGVDPTPLGGVLEIAPRSVAVFRGDYGLEIDPLDAESLAMGVLGLFSGSYRTVTVESSLVHFDALLGTVGVITTALLPDSDGTMGISSKECLVTGYDWSPFEGRGTITLMLSELNIGGYAPQVLVASQVNDAGNQWTITVTLTGYTTETSIGAWMAVGDEVRVVERNTASPTTVVGTVDAIPTATSVQVTFDATWTPAGGTASWWLGYDTTAAVDEAAPSGRRWAQTAFAKIGGLDRLAALTSGDVACQEFA